jgi:hypothetical protein
MSEDFWLNLEIRWDLYKAQQTEKEALNSICDYHQLNRTAYKTVTRQPGTVRRETVEPGPRSASWSGRARRTAPGTPQRWLFASTEFLARGFLSINACASSITSF